MAGDWIKMRCNLWDDPRVAAICDLTDSGEAAVIGALYWLWSTADQHTEDGCMPGLTLRQIDRKTGLPGFGSALVQVGWLVDDPQGVVIQGFDEHNGASAKKRCQTAQRVASSRSRNAHETQQDDVRNASIVTGALAREEKRREEEKEPNTKTARKRAAPAVLVSLSDLVAEGVEEQHATDWLVARKAKDLPLTPTAWAQTKAEAVKAEMTPAEAIKVAAGNGWAGFKASWLSQSGGQRGAGAGSVDPFAGAH